MKHIEQILPEYAAEELERIVREEGDATASAALSRLLHDWTGCAIPPTADTPQSEVEELVPLCLSILRRHWTTPLTALGDGTTPMSLADLLRRLIGDRVQGNEALGIPPFTANISTAVAALRDRDMSSGLTLTLTDGTIMPLPDGLSLAQLLCGSIASQVTEVKDSNTGWTFSGTLSKISSSFTALTKLVLGCETIDYSNNNGWSLGITGVTDLQLPYLKTMSNHDGWYNGYGFVGLNCETITLPEFLQFSNDHYGRVFANCDGLKYIYLPKFQRMTFVYGHALAYNCPELLEVYAPHLQEDVTGQWEGCINNCPKLQRLTVGNSSNIVISGSHPDLLEIRLGEDQTKSLSLRTWSPTLDSSNIPEFLSNFKTYIAQRLTDKGSGLTLTLSQAVRDAIQQDPDIVNIITSKGWTISPAPSV